MGIAVFGQGCTNGFSIQMRPVNVYRPLITYLLAEAAEAAGAEALAVPLASTFQSTGYL